MRPYPASAPTLLMLCFVLFSIGAYARYDVTQAAPRPATASECAGLVAQGVPCTPGVTLYNPDSIQIGDEVAIATQFLLERNGTGTRGAHCYSSQSDRITKLNPQFRVGLYKALSEIERLYGGKNIIQSGYRCDGSNGNHPRGCAVDIIWASCKANTRGHADPWRCSSDSFDAPEQKWIDANGKNAPYNIHIRLRYAPEGHHVEPVNTRGCVTGGTVGSGATRSPSSGVANLLRNALGLPQPSAPQPLPPMPSQPLPQAQSPLTAFQPVTDPPGATGAPGPSEPLISPQAPGPESSAAILERLAFGTPPTQTATTATTTVVVTASEAVMLSGARNDAAVASTSPYVPTTITGGNTFTTQDLAWDSGTAPEQGIAAVLAEVRNSLTHMAAYLRPFGRPYNNEGLDEMHDY